MKPNLHHSTAQYKRFQHGVWSCIQVHIGSYTKLGQQHRQKHHSFSNCGSDCKTETRVDFTLWDTSQLFMFRAHRSDRASRASHQALHHKCCMYAHLTTVAAAYQVEGGHHGQEHCSIFMMALISCGVKKELPSYSALQHSTSQLLEALPHSTVQLVGPHNWQL